MSATGQTSSFSTTRVDARLRTIAPTAPPNTPVGAMVGGYRIVRELARGGMGVVYLAEHPVIRTRVAIKVLLPQLAAIADMASRFIKEAQAVALISHPNIVRIFDLTTLPTGQPCIVMEHIEGETLEQRLSREALPQQTALAVLMQVGSALSAAHERGIIHRDLKPQNILVQRAPSESSILVKLLDFGLAKITGEERLTENGATMGTPHYMAPEQIQGGDVDARTDVYALGVLAYRLLTGYHPFEAETISDILVKHLAGNPAPPPGLPASVGSVILRALMKAQADRQQDVAAFCRALDEAYRGRGRPVTLPTPAAKPAPAAAPCDLSTLLDQHCPGLEKRLAGGHYTLLDLPRDADFSAVAARAELVERALMNLYPKAPPILRIDIDELMAKLADARQALTDPEQRALYDAEIGNLPGILRALGAGVAPERIAALHEDYAHRHPERVQRALALSREAITLSPAEAPRAAALWKEALRHDPLSQLIQRQCQSSLNTTETGMHE